MDIPAPAAKNTNAFFAQSAAAFGIALLTMLIAIFYLPGDPWPKAFLALGTLFLTTSAFTLAKCDPARRLPARPGPHRPDPRRARPVEGGRLSARSDVVPIVGQAPPNG